MFTASVTGLDASRVAFRRGVTQTFDVNRGDVRGIVARLVSTQPFVVSWADGYKRSLPEVCIFLLTQRRFGFFRPQI
jgi:hypothetical protein